MFKASKGSEIVSIHRSMPTHVGYAAAVWDPNLEMVQHNDIDLFPDSKAETA